MATLDGTAARKASNNRESKEKTASIKEVNLTHKGSGNGGETSASAGDLYKGAHNLQAQEKLVERPIESLLRTQTRAEKNSL